MRGDTQSRSKTKFFYKSLGLIVVVENPTLAKEIQAQRETKHK